MPEYKDFPQENGHGGDIAQNQTHQSELEELAERLADVWDSMGELDYDTSRIDVCLAACEAQEPMFPIPDVEVSLQAFHEKHAQLFAAGQPEQAAEAPKRRRCLSSIAAIAAVLALCFMMTAQAAGFDVLQALVRWTEEVFHFSQSSPATDAQPNQPIMPTGDYATLQDALDAHEITVPVAPKWYPEGCEGKKITASTLRRGRQIIAIYQLENQEIAITVWKYSTSDGTSRGAFEKDNEGVILYERGNITHYILANNNHLTASWMADEDVSCTLFGNLTVEQAERMIDSIYEEN